MLKMLHDFIFPPVEKIRAKALREAHRLREHYLLAHEECEAMIAMYDKRIARLEAKHTQESACTP